MSAPVSLSAPLQTPEDQRVLMVFARLSSCSTSQCLLILWTYKMGRKGVEDILK